MAFRPLYDRILVKRIDRKSDHEQWSLYSRIQEKPLEAEVVAVGQGRRTKAGEYRPVSP